MSLTREDWANIRDAWNEASEQEAEQRQTLLEQAGHVRMTGYNAYGALVDENGNPVTVQTIDTGQMTYSASVVPSPELLATVRREVARTLYALLRSEEANVVEMSEEEFMTFCERVMSEGK